MEGMNRRKKIHPGPMSRSKKRRYRELRRQGRQRTKKPKMMPCEIQFPNTRHRQKIYGRTLNQFGVYEDIANRQNK